MRKDKRTLGSYSGIWHLFLPITILGIALNILLHSNVRHSLLDGYEGDSFYTLGNVSAVGLVVIALALILFVLCLSWFFSGRWIVRSIDRSPGYKLNCLILNLCIITTVYSIMLVLAPQLFYLYYQWVFTNLPVQWVIKPIPFQKLINLISLPSGASIADHLAGFFWWVLVFNTVVQWFVGIGDRNLQTEA